MSASLSVEISSYVILAKLSHSPSNEDLGYATRIVRWLIGQQNYFGGFYSTQVRPKQLNLRRNWFIDRLLIVHILNPPLDFSGENRRVNNYPKKNQ